MLGMRQIDDELIVVLMRQGGEKHVNIVHKENGEYADCNV